MATDQHSTGTEFTTTGHPHPFHLVRPSIWPLAASFAAGALALLTVLFMHDASIFGISPGLVGIGLGFLTLCILAGFWWRDMIYESVVEKAISPVAAVGWRYGMLLFIASEVMFFVAFFWAFFASSLFPVETIGFSWPPPHIEVIPPFQLPLLMTMILLLSGCTVTWAHQALLDGNNDQAVKALGLSVLLGAVFLAFQVYEYHHAAFGFKDTVYASTFYMTTGFHGFHVFVGTVFLFVCWIRARKGEFTRKNHFGFEAAAWYWHFVDVVWLFLFVAIYWWGNTVGVQSIFAS